MAQESMEIALLKYNKKTWSKSAILGFIIGLAVIIPGISGSTVAIIFKLYDQFLYAIGNICAGLEYNDKNGTSNPALRYQLAIPRTIRVHDSTANIETDYPWVLATGYQAIEGKDALRIGSVVYIKGHLRSKEQVKEIQCAQCGSVFTSLDFPLMRISPHFTEYLHNCNFPDSTSSSPKYDG